MKKCAKSKNQRLYDELANLRDVEAERGDAAVSGAAHGWAKSAERVADIGFHFKKPGDCVHIKDVGPATGEVLREIRKNPGKPTTMLLKRRQSLAQELAVEKPEEDSDSSSESASSSSSEH
jgi:hypothetical protein